MAPLGQALYYALKIHRDPTRCLRDILALYIFPRFPYTQRSFTSDEASFAFEIRRVAILSRAQALNEFLKTKNLKDSCA